MGAFSFCSALDLDMLTFDSQNEEDIFLKFLKANSTFTLQTMDNGFNIYLGAYAVKAPANANGFIWYRTGKSTTETLTLDWYAGEPNNAGNEMCTTIMQLNGLIGLNDYSCTLSDLGIHFKNAIVCQYRYNLTEHGYSPKYL